MFLLVSVRHVGAHPDELQHGVPIQSFINLGKTLPRKSRIRIIPSTQILARVFVYLPPFISQILDIICRMVLIFILIYFEWRDTENQQLAFGCLRAVVGLLVVSMNTILIQKCMNPQKAAHIYPCQWNFEILERVWLILRMKIMSA